MNGAKRKVCLTTTQKNLGPPSDWTSQMQEDFNALVALLGGDTSGDEVGIAAPGQTEEEVFADFHAAIYGDSPQFEHSEEGEW